jgi:phosphoesterase RecJ-like protein
VYVSEPVPALYQFVPRVDQCRSDKAVLQDPTIDLVITFDCSDASFVASWRPYVNARAPLINIDHHATNPMYGNMNLVDAKAPATAELLYRLLRQTNIHISDTVALCLLAGICFDTSLLSNSGTNEGAYRMMADLVRSGGSLELVRQSMRKHRSVPGLRLWGKALERLTEHPILRSASTYFLRSDLEEFDASDDEIGGLSNFLNYVLNVDTLLVLKESKDGGVTISMRSRVRNVATLARLLGGGGHSRAAGVSIPRVSIASLPSGGHSISRT